MLRAKTAGPIGAFKKIVKVQNQVYLCEDGFPGRVRTLSRQRLRSSKFIETSVHLTLDRGSAPDCGPPIARLWSGRCSQGLCPHSVAAWLSVLTLQKNPSDANRVSGEASQPQQFNIPPKFIFVGLWGDQTSTQLLSSSPASSAL